jgi:hypothetical protein
MPQTYRLDRSRPAHHERPFAARRYCQSPRPSGLATHAWSSGVTPAVSVSAAVRGRAGAAGVPDPWGSEEWAFRPCVLSLCVVLRGHVVEVRVEGVVIHGWVLEAGERQVAMPGNPR